MISRLVFRRFADIDSIVAELITLGAEHPEVRESNENIGETSDLELDGRIGNSEDECDDFTLCYVLTRDDEYLITEAYYWNEGD